jgi:hypothetical protein
MDKYTSIYIGCAAAYIATLDETARKEWLENYRFHGGSRELEKYLTACHPELLPKT